MADLKYEIYFMNVPFNSTYQHTVLFDSLDDQINTFKTKGANNHYTNLNIIIKNSEFIVNGGKLENLAKFNYMMYKSNEDTKWTYSFIDDIIYDSYRGTRITHHIDVWQTYQWYSHWHTAFIERGCVANDTIGRWLAPEPVGFGAEEEHEINIFEDLDFNPIVVLESLSKPELKVVTMKMNDAGAVSHTENINTTKFYYGGIGVSENITGLYRIIPSQSYLQNLLSLWQNPEYVKEMDKGTTFEIQTNYNNLFQQSNNHIGDIVSFKFIPEFILHTTSPSTISILGKDDNDNIVTVGNLLNYSFINSKNDSVNINNSVLACVNSSNIKYKPKNNKMFTSLARAFKIFNYDGLNIPLKPELISNLVSSHTLNISISSHTYGDDIKIFLNNYNDIDINYQIIPYTYSFNYGINNNVGVARETKISAYNIARLNKTIGYIEKGIGFGTSLASANIAGEMAQMGGGLAQKRRELSSISHTGSLISQPTSFVGDLLQNEFDLGIQRANAYTSQTLNIGNASGDRINLNANNIKLRFAECNPTYNECQVIDDFLSRYGYTIMEFGQLYSWCTTRPHWNYIKTKDANITADAPNNDIRTFNAIFNNGTTIWHNIDEVGDFTLNNSI